MDNFLFLGFADELVKLSAEGSLDSNFKNALTGAGAVGGAIPLSLIGTLAAGKGRRGKGALAGLLAGALLGGAGGRHQAGETLKALGSLDKEGEDKGFYNTLKDEGVSPGRTAATGATNLGALGAILGLLTGKKGQRLKRALFTGGATGAMGGLAGLGLGSKVLSDAIDTDKLLR